MHERTCVSLFSGIGGLDEGLRRAGFRHLLLCEGGGDPSGTKAEREQWKQGCYRRSVLRERFPGVPVFSDVAALRFQPAPGASGDGDIAVSDGAGRVHAVPVPDLLCGGFPCQDLSVAGRRAGLAGDRSGLFFEFARVAESLRPGAVLVENVPGLLSSNGGRDFGVVLGTLAELGYGLGWRILDSRFFGVPQRRRRLFIVGTVAGGCTGAERAAEILSVGTRCARHPATRGEAGPDVAGTLGASAGKGRGHDGNPFDRGGHSSLSGMGSGGPDDNDAQAGRLIAETVRSHPRAGSATPGLLAFHPTGDGEKGLTVTEDQTPGIGTGNGGTVAIAGTLKAQRGKAGGGIGPEETLVAAPLSHGSNPNSNAAGRRREDDENIVSYALNANERWDGESETFVPDEAAVRRLTPVECERLQGFPDGWTDVDGAADSPRYAALGDAVTVNVSEWIGRRLVCREA